MTDELESEAMDERFVAAMVWPRRMRMEAWYRDMQQHRQHPTFTKISDVWVREMGFSCQCTGTEVRNMVPLAGIKEALPTMRADFKRFFCNPKSRKEKRAEKTVENRARSLLFRYLTRKQKQELRATGKFSVNAKDGRTYTIGNNHHTGTTHNGHAFSFCVVPKGSYLPVYDLMLAHKIMIETNVEEFLRTAHIQQIGVGMVENEPFILGQIVPQHNSLADIVITDEDTYNPEPWVQECLNHA